LGVQVCFEACVANVVELDTKVCLFTPRDGLGCCQVLVGVDVPQLDHLAVAELAPTQAPVLRVVRVLLRFEAGQKQSIERRGCQEGGDSTVTIRQ